MLLSFDAPVVVRPLCRLLLIIALQITVPVTTVVAAGIDDVPLLVLLEDTGQERDGLPVLVPHEDASEVTEALMTGLPATLFRVYRMEQYYLHEKDGTAVEPAYVLLSERQGGYAREGFYLGETEKQQAGYVDVKYDWPVAGSFGAMDQIVSHELAHVIRRQLVGPLTEGHANQVHGTGVRTDRVVAFNEGFAEHLQVMAIDHPDAHGATRELATNYSAYEGAKQRLTAYRRELTARLSVAPRMRMGFLAWFSNDEDVLRYFAVKDNAFAREPDVPARLLASDPYKAYLLESTLPGAPDGRLMSVSRMMETEGVVSTFFYRWATDSGLRDTYREPSFYDQFGTAAAEISPLENVYLKLFHVFYVHKPQSTFDVIAGYRMSFPAEAHFVDALFGEVFHEPLTEPAAEIWLANPALQTGTSLYDQYRGLPRTHTFNLNAASVVDLVAVPGIDQPLASLIMAAAPFDRIEDLQQVPGVSGALIDRLLELEKEMEALLVEFAAQDEDEVLSVNSIIRPFLWRALWVLVGAALAAMVVYRFVRARARDHDTTLRHAAINGFGAAAVGVLGNWLLGGVVGLGLVVILFGLPAAIWTLSKTRQQASAGWVLLAWTLAAVPAVLLTVPLL